MHQILAYRMNHAQAEAGTGTSVKSTGSLSEWNGFLYKILLSKDIL